MFSQAMKSFRYANTIINIQRTYNVDFCNQRITISSPFDVIDSLDFSVTFVALCLCLFLGCRRLPADSNWQPRSTLSVLFLKCCHFYTSLLSASSISYQWFDKSFKFSICPYRHFSGSIFDSFNLNKHPILIHGSQQLCELLSDFRYFATRRRGDESANRQTFFCLD